MNLNVPVRKKLTMALLGLVINWAVAWLRIKGIDVSLEDQKAIIDLTMQISGAIVGLFMIGQGIADKGKEAGKTLLILFLCGSLLTVGLPAYAQPEGPESEPTISCCGDYEACMILLNECSGTECPICAECNGCDEITIKEALLDKKLRGALILLVAGVIGAVIPLFITPQ